MENTKSPGARSGQTSTETLNEILRQEVIAGCRKHGIVLKPTASAQPPAGYRGGFAPGYAATARRGAGRLRR
jgi:hypothetical protein